MNRSVRRPLIMTAAIALAAALGTAALAGWDRGGTANAQDPTLHDLAAAQGKYFGVAADNNEIADAEYAETLGSEFGWMTPGNAMKWDATEPQQGQFEFDRADEIVAFAEVNGQELRGHTLIWHNQTPTWVQQLPADEMRAAVDEHISTVVGRYADELDHWDVANEVYDDSGNLRDSFWLQTLGEDYIADAFHAARAADPDAKLYLNDYNIDGVNAKSDAYYELVQRLLADGVPIDGIGLQGHLIVGQIPATVQENIQRFADLGLEVAITELDIRMELPADDAKLAQQAQDYGAVTEACMAVEACVGITLWAYSDKYSWIPSVFPGQGAALPWDENLQPKPAYQAIRDALSGQTQDAPATAIEQHGQLSVCGTKLCDAAGEPVQLKGMSTHGLQWHGDCVNDASLDALAGDWGSDIVRISMYVQEDGYETDPEGFTAQVSGLIDDVTSRGMYALVDWHILTPGDPNVNLEAAKTFFAEIAETHADNPGVLYETANEPNGVSWADLKGYHEQVIPVIRERDPDSVIILGTRAWSSFGINEGSDASEIANDPVDAENVMYTFHFYAASHRESYIEAVAAASEQFPVFVTEWGTQTYTGDGENDFAMSQQWTDMMAEHQISWANWNYSDDFRSGAVFTEGTCPNGPYTGASNLKPAGVWIRDQILAD